MEDSIQKGKILPDKPVGFVRESKQTLRREGWMSGLCSILGLRACHWNISMRKIMREANYNLFIIKIAFKYKGSEMFRKIYMMYN